MTPKEKAKQIKCYCGHTTYCDCSPLEEHRKQTAVEWLLENLNSEPYSEEEFNYNRDCWDKAKEMEKEQMCIFAEFVATYPDKNKNINGEMLHAKSKYDGAERTVDLLETFKSE